MRSLRSSSVSLGGYSRVEDEEAGDFESVVFAYREEGLNGFLFDFMARSEERRVGKECLE